MKYKTDVLVVGAGGAGLRAAIEAADNNVNVLVLGKTLLGKAHTVMAEGGINAALGNIDPEDSWEVHFADTMTEGHLLNDWVMVEAMVKEAPEILLELENFGAIFDRTKEGKISQRAFGGHTYKRTCHIGDRTGLEIMQVLRSEAGKRKKITSLEEVMITKLVKQSNKIIGAIGVSLRTGKIVVVECKSIILATGGHARIYSKSTNAWENVGDGYALALTVGAELMDMEMVQFHPTGMVYPETAEGILVTESVRGEGGILTNALGQRFMKKYDPKKMELSTRDIVSRAVFNEIKQGRGTKRNGVWLDISHKPKNFIEKKLPKMISKFKDFAHVDITKEKMEIAPTAHYAMGGIRTDPETCHSKIKGLFAAGEINGGVHGANRLGGNSLIDILVFGKKAGKHAALYAKKTKRRKIKNAAVQKERIRLYSPFKKKSGTRAVKLKRKLQKLMWDNVGIVRTGVRLKKSLKELRKIKEKTRTLKVTGSKTYNPDWIQYLNLLSMLSTCEMIIKSALARKESRGAHYRKDYPEKEDNWKKHIVVQMKNKKIYVFITPISIMPARLRELLE